MEKNYDVEMIVILAFILGIVSGVSSYVTMTKDKVTQPEIIVIQNPPIVQPSGVYCIDDMVNNVLQLS